MFVAVSTSGNTNGVMTSPDGNTWTLRTTPNNVWAAVAWNGSYIVAVAINGTNRSMKSVDGGQTWTANSCPARAWTSIAWSPVLNIWAAVSGDGYVMTSPDGEVWTEYTPSVTDKVWTDITWGYDRFVAVNSGPAPSVPPPEEGCPSVGYAVFYYTNQVMISTDGVTWTCQDMWPGYFKDMYDANGDPLIFDNKSIKGYSTACREIIYKDCQFLCFHQVDFNTTGFQEPWNNYYPCQVSVSCDGTQWAPIFTHADFKFARPTGAIAGPDKIVACATQNANLSWSKPIFIYSTDGGTTWIPVVPDEFHNQLFSVAYGGGKYASVGGPLSMIDTYSRGGYSSDGITWTFFEPPDTNTWNDVAWCAGDIVNENCFGACVEQPATLTIYYMNKNPAEVSTHAKYITDIQDLNSNNWKHLKSIYAVGDYGDNTITLSWTKYPTYENWQQLVGKTSDYTTYGDVPVWYNLGQARRPAFMLQWNGDSQINHEAMEVTYNIKTQ